MRRFRKTPQAFTLVEILVVVGIIALLSVIAIPQLIRAKVTANEAAAKGNLKSIVNALENYYALNNVYPPGTSQLMGASPPYLSVDYFSGTHNGYSFTINLTDYAYTITASPINANVGTSTFTMTTGGVLTAF